MTSIDVSVAMRIVSFSGSYGLRLPLGTVGARKGVENKSPVVTSQLFYSRFDGSHHSKLLISPTGHSEERSSKIVAGEIFNDNTI